MNWNKPCSSILRRNPLLSFSQAPRIVLIWTFLLTLGVTAQAQKGDHPCNVSGFAHETWDETKQFGHGLRAVPRGVIRRRNLIWEMPILAATGVMIAKMDRPAD